MRLAANDVVGAIVTDVDAAALDAAGFAAIDDALLKHQMLAIRDQRLTPEGFIAFARRFGPIDLHVLDRYWMPGHPEIYVISNIVEDGRPIGNAREGFGWHTDLSSSRRITGAPETSCCGTTARSSTLPPSTIATAIAAWSGEPRCAAKCRCRVARFLHQCRASH